ncbi:aldehyde dehydrogenase family protein [Streptomyces ficellus]|uniref:Aldehyde dehydrogenase family protein n=1 Tax=Streptomyces ficellus TaxID=1977088 RepID=A0ABT7Z3K8_9ACTN|nr:aldehyde dehydrogenase family protein [Streptomyces ficellus]MDN3294082.1 aldehyde dehydrogenase family protein [Streptomyces ficellus]
MRRALHDRGVRAGDRVVLSGDNTIEFHAAVLSLIASDVSLVVLDRAQLRRPGGLAGLRAGHTVLQGDLVKEVPGAIALRDLWDHGPGTVTSAEAGGAAELPDFRTAAWRRREDGLILLSSGTTGAPRAVVKSGGSFIDNCVRTAERVQYTPDDVLLPLLPMTHQYGLSVALLSWIAGTGLLVVPPEHLSEALRLGKRHRATVVDAPPRTYRAILGLAARNPALLDDLSAVRMWCVGGGPLEGRLAESFHRASGRQLLDGYGSTELGNVAHAWPDRPEVVEALPGVEVRVVDAAGAPVLPGKVGELLVRTPDQYVGGLDAEGRTVFAERGWQHTEDIASVGADGNLTVLGRRSALSRGGFTVYPAEVQRRLTDEGVTNVCAVVDDAERGQRLVTVVADPGRNTHAHWRREISAHLAAYETPDHVFVVDELPLNGFGKVDVGRVQNFAEAATAQRLSAPRLLGEPFRSDRRLTDTLAALARTADYVHAEKERFVKVLGEITDRQAAEIEIDGFVATLRGAAAEYALHRPPRVPASWVFMPSNVVLYSYALYLLVPALFTERISFRPSSRCADVTLRLHEMLAPVHGLDVTAFTGTQGEYADAIRGNAGTVVFTGRYENAEELRVSLGDEQLFLFFGQGVNPFIITGKADVEKAAADGARVRMLNSGQDCLAPDLYFVQRAVAEEFREALSRRVGALRFGEIGDSGTDYGSIHDPNVLQQVTRYLIANRRRIHRGGVVDVTRSHLLPTVLVWEADEPLDVAEQFAPVFNLVVYDDEATLKRVLNTKPFLERAFGASVYGAAGDLVEFLRERHMVSVDSTLIEIDNGNKPFGGSGVRAGYAAQHGRRFPQPLLISKAVAEYGNGLGAGAGRLTTAARKQRSASVTGGRRR